VSGVSQDRIPVLVGAAQWVERDVDLNQALEPVAALERVARGAAEDAELKPRTLAELDTVAIPDMRRSSAPDRPESSRAASVARRPSA